MVINLWRNNVDSGSRTLALRDLVVRNQVTMSYKLSNYCAILIFKDNII